MGKKRIVKKGGESEEGPAKQSGHLSRRELGVGTLHIHATYNNTKVLLADTRGNTVAWSSSGSLGFKGAKKGTPFAAAKVGELIGERATQLGMREANAVVRGVGSGRESALRAFSSKGIQITGIKDTTPIPFNGPRPPKPRRV
ncbi:30S ribosomal protein S11 [Candidatus Kaiserbacteria bacterium RIFCSPHIGHO2_01_FULL_51_33]|nr:MAG: 30S ribosomal protein S11 [Candidatus Kaiserbacteria bacterium RIFCSPHIGHO2_01_FULL_51_33]